MEKHQQKIKNLFLFLVSILFIKLCVADVSPTRIYWQAGTSPEYSSISGLCKYNADKTSVPQQMICTATGSILPNGYQGQCNYVCKYIGEYAGNPPLVAEDVWGMDWSCPTWSGNSAFSPTCTCVYPAIQVGGRCIHPYIYPNPDDYPPDPEKDQGPPPACSSAGNPCDIRTGRKYQSIKIFDFPSSPNFSLALNYNSQTTENQSHNSIGPFGINWTSQFGRAIAASSPDVAILQLPQGGKIFYTHQSGQLFLPEVDRFDRLIRLVATDGSLTGWRHESVSTGEVEIYDALGRIISLVPISGGEITFTYSDSNTTNNVDPIPGHMIEAKHFGGRKIRFIYDGKELITKAIGPSNEEVQFFYDSNRNLTEIRYQNSLAFESKKFHYNEISNTGGNDLPHHLTGMTDENGVRFANYYYDASGRAVETVHVGNARKHQLSYGTQSTTVIDPLGQTRTYSYKTILGIKRLTEINRSPSGGVPASASKTTYDAKGNILSQDDFNGTRYCFGYDSTRNLENVRVEGLTGGSPGDACSTITLPNASLPVGSRKTSTQWHPNWNIKVRVAEPGKITTYVYNGQPDPTANSSLVNCAPTNAQLPDGKPLALLCRVVEQGTNDSSGTAGFSAAPQSGVPKKITNWTYNKDGQKLTEDGPRTDVSDVTTYTYHATTAFTGTDPNAVGVTLGDLKSITNVAGTTQYTKYNKHGQLLESIDPNGVVSSYTYDLRQRLLSSAVGGQHTTLVYDPAGQLKKVTWPDASWTGYEYDAAHRLTDVYNNLGNRITYTLDNAGNRELETVRDPSNVLKRQLARSIDALGRVHHTTGRE